MEQSESKSDVTSQERVSNPVSPTAPPTARVVKVGGSSFGTWIVCLLLIVVIVQFYLLNQGLNQAVRARPLTKWEYVTVNFEDLNLDRDMNGLGTLGWELVAARRATGNQVDYLGKTKVGYECIFKRLLP